MPQMSPHNWMILMIMSATIMTLWNQQIHMNFKPSIKMKKMKPKSKKLAW